MTNIHEIHSGKKLTKAKLEERSVSDERRNAKLAELKHEFENVTVDDALQLSADIDRNLARGLTEGSPGSYTAAKAMFAELMAYSSDHGQALTDREQAALNNYLLYSDVGDVLRDRDDAGLTVDSIEEMDAMEKLHAKKTDLLRPVLPAELLRRVEYIRDHLEDYWGTDQAKEELDRQLQIVDSQLPELDVIDTLTNYGQLLEMNVRASIEAPEPDNLVDLHGVKRKRKTLNELTEAKEAFASGRRVPLAGNDFFNHQLDRRFQNGADRYRAKQQATLNFVREKVKLALATFRTQE